MANSAPTEKLFLCGLSFNKRVLRIAAAIQIVIFVVLLWHYLFTEEPVAPPPTIERHIAPTSSFSPANVNDPGSKSLEELCASFPKHKLLSVQPVLKTGYGEKQAKVDAQMNSVSACFEPGELLVYSDENEMVGKHQAVDVIAMSPREYFDPRKNGDIKPYMKQKKLVASGETGPDGKVDLKKNHINGWVSDKYKFLPMIEQAWKAKPGKDFYFFYEIDTYVFWDNAFRWLESFDPDEPLYMGSSTPGGMVDEKIGYQVSFANGGPGFILSRGAVKRLLHVDAGFWAMFQKPFLSRWGPTIWHDCCGDSVLGWVLYRDPNITLSGYWPLFNPHALHSVPFSDLYWCQPPITLHKTTPEDMVDLFKWEFGQRQAEKPLLYKDLWHFHHPGVPSTKSDWDNGEWDAWEPAPEDKVDSADSCEKFCQDHDDCLQWSWQGRDRRRCLAMRSIRYNRARAPHKLPPPKPKPAPKGEKPPPPPEDPNHWADYTAGWMTERIDRWRESRTCDVPDWVPPSLERTF